MRNQKIRDDYKTGIFYSVYYLRGVLWSREQICINLNGRRDINAYLEVFKSVACYLSFTNQIFKPFLGLRATCRLAEVHSAVNLEEYSGSVSSVSSHF